MGIVSREDYNLISGRGVGNSLTDFLDSADRRIWIVSHLVDEKYARQLKRKYNNGVDVKLVTESDYESQEESFKQIFDTKESSQTDLFYRFRYLFLFIALISLIGVGMGFQYGSELVAVPVALAVIFGGLTVLAYFTKEEKVSYTSPIDLYLNEPENWVTNSRIYILDDKVLVGTADLTEDGLWKNMEMLFELKDEEARNQIESMFKDIINELERDEARTEEIDGEVFEN